MREREREFGQLENAKQTLHGTLKMQLTESSSEGELSRDAHNRSSSMHNQVNKANWWEAATRHSSRIGIKHQHVIWTGEERTGSVWLAGSRQPRGREKRFRNILQPVSSQWVSVRVEEREEEMPWLLNEEETDSGDPLSIQFFSHFLISSPEELYLF